MKVKNINYSNSHIPELKKYIAWLALFALGISIIAILQAYMIIDVNKKNIDLSNLEMIASFGCLIMCIVFALFMLVEISRYIVLIKKINTNGNIENKTYGFDYSRKFSFGNMFRLFEYIILTASVIFVIGFATYCVLNYVYYTTINYYLPIALMVLVTTFYSTKLFEFKYELER